MQISLDPTITDPMPPVGTEPLVSTPAVWRSHEYVNGQFVEYDFDQQTLTVEQPPWGVGRAPIIIPILRIVRFRDYHKEGYISFDYLPREQGFKPRLRGHTMSLDFQTGPDGSYSYPRSSPPPPQQFHDMARAMRRGVNASTAHAALTAFGFQPVGSYPGQYEPWSIRCNLGHDLKPLPLANLLYIGDAQDSWCLSCRREFKDMAVWVYLMQRDGQMKIGVSNAPNLRRAGLGPDWEVLDTSGPWSRSDAISVETDVLRALRSRGIPLGPDAWETPFDGSHETWPSEHFHPESLAQLSDELDLDPEW